MLKSLRFLLLLATACSSDPPKGSCAFVDPADNTPMCVENLDKPLCAAKGFARTYPATAASQFRFTPEGCSTMGFTKCSQSRQGFDFYKPCPGDEKPAPTEPAKPVATPFKLPPAGEPGPAYIALTKGVAVILADGTAQVVQGVKDEVRLLAVGADGFVYGSTAGSGGLEATVYKFTGATAKRMGGFKNGPSTALGVDKNGVVYGAQGKEVARLEGGKITVLPDTAVGTVNGISFDDEGALVIVGPGTLKRLVDGAWQDLSKDIRGNPWLLGTGPTLTIVSDGISTLRGGKRAPVYKDAETFMTSRPGLSSSGVLVGRETLANRDGGITNMTKSLSGSLERVVDDQGRAWFVESSGLTVASLVGTDNTTYSMGTLPALTLGEAYSRAHQIVVVGSGPRTLPPVEAPRMVEKVTATLVVGRKPLANAEVSICPSPASPFQNHPCENTTAGRYDAKTDDKGVVTFDKVLVGSYWMQFVVRGWTAGDNVLLTEAAATRDLGTLRY